MREKSETNGFVNGHKMLHGRWLRSILPVEKVLGGYYRELGVTFNGGELIADRSTPTV